MKITHVITTIERGGAEKAVLALATAQAKSGHSVSVVPLKGKPELKEKFCEKQISVHLDALNMSPLNQIQILKRLIVDSEIIHSHLPRAELITRLAFGSAGLMITRHNSEKFFPKAPSLISSLLSRWVTRNSSLIAISKAVSNFLVKNKEISSNCDVNVIYYGYESQNKESNSRENCKDSEAIILGTISRLTPQKNLQLLLHFIQLQVLKGRQVFTRIVGEGPIKEELEALALKLGIKDYISFLGKIENVQEFLESLDFFLLTSNYEGFGLSLLEAFDSNVPVIASNVSAIPEVMGINHPGLFACGSLESLEMVFEGILFSKHLRSQTLAAQQERLSFFNMKNYLENHEIVYAKHLHRLQVNFGST